MFSWFFSKTPLLFFTQPFWRDEAFSYLLAKKSIFDILILTAKDFNPPLYYLVLHFWIKFFGNSEIALRSLSLIFFWGTIYVVFLFLTNIFKIKSLIFTICYLIFAILNPLLLYYAFEARMYSMFAFLSVLSFYALFKKNKKIYLLSTIAGLYTHYFMIFILIIQYFIFKSKDQIKAFFYIIPWFIFIILNQGINLSSFWIEKNSIKKFINFIGSVYTGYEYNFNFFNKDILRISLLLYLIIFSGIFFLKIKNKFEKILFKTLFFVGFLTPLLISIFSFVKPIFLPRYLIFANVSLLLLLIFIIEKYPKILKISILILLFLITINYHQLQIKERKKSNIRKTLREIKYLMKKNDVLYVLSELDFFTAQYYLNEDKVFIWQKSYEEIPDYVGKVLIPKEKIVYNLPVYPKKAFILESSEKYSIQSIY